MTAGVYIDRIGWSVGERASTVEEAAATGLLVSEPSALREAGFAVHHMCAPGRTGYDLARAAVETIRDGLGEIGAIIYSTCIPLNAAIGDEHPFRKSPDVKNLMDFPASHLQSDFALD